MGVIVNINKDMKIKEIMESSLDWRYHSTKDYNHDDVLADIEAEMKNDIKQSEESKKETQKMKRKDKPETAKPAGPVSNHPNKSNPNAGPLSAPMNFGGLG